MIPDEAVEAAARAICEIAGIPWNPYLVQNDEARSALEAALPYLSEAAKQPQRTSPTDWPDIPKARS